MRLSLTQHRYLLRNREKKTETQTLKVPLVKMPCLIKPCPKSEPEESVDEELSIEFVELEGIHSRHKTWSPEWKGLSYHSIKTPTHKPQLQDLSIFTEASPRVICKRLPVSINTWLGAKSNLRTLQREQFQEKVEFYKIRRERNESLGIRKWKLLRDVIRSVMLFKHQNAVGIEDNISDHLQSEFLVSDQSEGLFDELKPLSSFSSFSNSSECVASRQIFLLPHQLNENESLSESISIDKCQTENTSPDSPLKLKSQFTPMRTVRQSQSRTPEKYFQSAQLSPRDISRLSPSKRGKQNVVKEGIQKKRRCDQLYDLIASGDLQQLALIEQIVKDDPAQQEELISAIYMS